MTDKWFTRDISLPPMCPVCGAWKKLILRTYHETQYGRVSCSDWECEKCEQKEEVKP